jgi:hypothetical protein
MINTRHAILEQLRQELGPAEQTEILIDYIEDLWETIDLLREQFGKERAQQIITAPCYVAGEQERL